MQPVQEAIRARRSVRDFTGQPVEQDKIQSILESGIWAPSGLNNQPWKFITIKDQKTIDKLAELTTYSHIVRAAPLLIGIFLDKEKMYDEVKDHQSAGACIQNMLLTVHELELGAVWLGQILKNKIQVNCLLKLDDQYDLMAFLAIGYPKHRNQKSQRKPLSDFIIQEI